MVRIGIKLGQKIPQHHGLELSGTDQNMLRPSLLEVDRVMKLVLYLKRLKELLQVRDDKDNGGKYKDSD